MAKQLRKTDEEKEKIMEALEEFVFKKRPLLTVSKEFNIPRNSLRRYAKRCSEIENFFTKSRLDKMEFIDEITTHHGTQVILKFTDALFHR